MSYTAMEAALFSILTTAVATVTGAPPLELDEPRLTDPPEEQIDDETGEPVAVNRFRAVLAPGNIELARQQLVTPPPYQLVTVFRVGLFGIGPHDTTRRALLRSMAAAIAGAVSANYTLNGSASFARATALDFDTAKDAGFQPETLLDLQIEVEFDGATSVG